MKMQTREYVEFVKNFTESTNIMTKSFFIVVPYSQALLNPTKNFTSGFFTKKTKEEKKLEEESEFEEKRSQLQQRIEVVEQGLVRCGVRIAPLGTEELIELFYKIFNPGDVEKPIHVG